MKSAGVSQYKNGLSKLLRSVKSGKSVLNFERNVPVARLGPIESAALPNRLRLQAIEHQGLIRRPLKAGTLPAALTTPRPRPKRGASLVAALLAERAEAGR